MSVVFVPTPGLESLIEHSEGVHDATKEKAERAESVAKALAPVLTGAFRDSIHVVENGTGYSVVADSTDEQGNPDAAYIEFGTSDTPAHHTLSDALQSLGGGG